MLLSEMGDGYTKHRMFFIGHMHEAEAESREWPELYEAIRQARKDFHTRKITPDWKLLAGLIGAVLKGMPQD